MRSLRRHKVRRKGKAARRFNKSFHRTKKPNLKRGVMRGGYRF